MKLGLLPANLGPAATLCDEGNPRYAMNGPRLQLTETGYRVDATNGRYALTVTGDFPHSPDEYPAIPALESAPNGGTEALIGRKEWLAAFKALPKAKRIKPILANVAVVIGSQQTTFGTTDLASANVSTAQNVEGRYPAIDEVYPKSVPQARIKVPARQLVELLNVLRGFTDDEHQGVWLTVYSPKAPLVLECDNPNTTQKARAVLMPLS